MTSKADPRPLGKRRPRITTQRVRARTWALSVGVWFMLASCAAGSPASTSNVDAVTRGAVAAAAVAPQNLMVGTSCNRSDSKYSACVYYQSAVHRFITAGSSATGFFTLVSFDQYEDHGRIFDNHGPPSPLAGDQSVWASYESNGAGIEAHVKYHVQEDPYSTADEVGWYLDMPDVGTNGGNCTDSEFVMCRLDLPGGKDWQATYRATFFNRPLVVSIHNNVPGLTVVKQGPEQVNGLLVEPAATNQTATNAALTPDGEGGGNGRGYFGGYRSARTDTAFAVQYEADSSVSPDYAGTTFAIQVIVNRDNPNTADKATGCTVSGQKATVRLQCKVSVTGSNDGQSLAAVEIFKN